MKKNRSKALEEVYKLAREGLVTIIFDESTNKTNYLKIRLEEFDEKGNLIDKTED